MTEKAQISAVFTGLLGFQNVLLGICEGFYWLKKKIHGHIGLTATALIKDCNFYVNHAV